ncbi:MAG: hypothetical protein Q9186_003132 [Xanthomendoza sp. 1 TL-2023]
MADWSVDNFKIRFTHTCNLNDPSDVAKMLKTVRQFIESLGDIEFSKILLEDRQLLDQFGDFVSRDIVFELVKIVVHQFPSTLAAADSFDLPTASLCDESEDEANESEDDEDDDYEEYVANDSEDEDGNYQEDGGNISEEDKDIMMEM